MSNKIQIIQKKLSYQPITIKNRKNLTLIVKYYSKFSSALDLFRQYNLKFYQFNHHNYSIYESSPTWEDFLLRLGKPIPNSY